MKVIIGAGGKKQDGWVSTEQSELDLLNRDDFSKILNGESGYEAILLEHTLEHLTEPQLVTALKNCFDFLLPGARLRIAVPDGLHPDPNYIDYVKPGGFGAGAGDHKILFNYRLLSRLLRQAGFEVCLLEWWDESGIFHCNPWYEEDGNIERSAANDERNRDGKLNYTSLIVDAIKPDNRSGLIKAFAFVEKYDIHMLSPFNRKKTTAFYELARSAPPSGVIVELGSHHGIGTAALYYGSLDGNRCPVIALDAFSPMHGWIGEPYGPEDMAIWLHNMREENIEVDLYRMDALGALQEWKRGISLLLHDLGCKKRMPKDVMDWEEHVILGGTIAMRDIDDYSMGTEAAIKNLLSTGRWGNRKNWDAFITSMEKIK